MKKLDIKAYYPVNADIKIVVYDVIHDIDDKIKFAWIICGKWRKTRYSKVRYGKEGRSYFKTHDIKIYLDECVHTERYDGRN